jgi:hypothetical protein
VIRIVHAMPAIESKPSPPETALPTGTSTASARRASSTASPPPRMTSLRRRATGVASASATKIASGVYAMMRVSSGATRSPSVSRTAQSPPSAALTAPRAGTEKRGAGAAALVSAMSALP